MNLKKQFKKEREHLEEKLYTEGDELYFKTVLEKVEDANISRTKTKRRIKYWVWLSSLSATLIAASIIIPVVFISSRPIHYWNENIKSEYCDMKNVYDNANYLIFNEYPEANQTISLYYDTLSLDKLYYKMEMKSNLQQSVIVLVVNEDYNYDFSVQGQTAVRQLENYTIEYIRDGKENSNGTDYKYSGWVKVESETAYFVYEQHNHIGDSDDEFFEDIQNIIRLK